ncbi:MAG: hypothetical protein ACYTBJ_24010 [Planctomycetota bacterium]|jgi:hypothetical protein
MRDYNVEKTETRRNGAISFFFDCNCLRELELEKGYDIENDRPAASWGVFDSCDGGAGDAREQLGG